MCQIMAEEWGELSEIPEMRAEQKRVETKKDFKKEGTSWVKGWVP